MIRAYILPGGNPRHSTDYQQEKASKPGQIFWPEILSQGYQK